MLFKLSLKNIKKSFKDYAIYFFTLILGISIFYVFNSLESQTVMLNLSKSSNNSTNMIKKVLSAISVFVSFVLGFLIIYANRFLMKRRKREFGIYMTLGMGKRSISKIIFFETVLIGIISLIIGLLFGIGLSQVMSIFVASLFEADMDKFRFVISNFAILKTIFYFFIIYIFVMLFNVIQVSRCKLIELIKSKSKSEKIKMKNPYVCIGVFIFAVILLSYAYYNVTANDNSNMGRAIDVYLQIIYGVVGTFLVFWSLSGFIMKLVMSMDKAYYNNLNSFTLRQLSSKINTTVASMSIICLMLFLTICIFSSSVSMNATLKSNMRKLATADISIYKEMNLEKTNEFGENYTKKQIDASKLSVEKVLKNRGFDINSNLTDIVSINKYQRKEITLKDLLGDYYETLKAKNPDQVESDKAFYNGKSDLIRISDYNKIAKLYGKETYDLKDNEYMVICNHKNMIQMYNEGLKSHPDITIGGKLLNPKYEEIKDGYITMSYDLSNTGAVLIPDDVVDGMCIGQILAGNYKASNKQGKEKTEDKVNEIRKEFYKENLGLGIMSKIDIYNYNISTSAMAVFIGLYVGLVFLISSGAILALRELSESADSKERYITLRRIGIDEKMINKSLFIQIAIFFGCPLLLGIIHSIFGIQVANIMLESFGRDGLMKSIIMTSIFIVAIYGGYFIVTYLCSKNIIKEA
ncbi:ABC transporter permease [Paraclostridium ghonii]|uniref:ABC transport system permease protein n=1 Tax=Paraclostridium ghonii TaxID=29358 RepID=A0ABU0MZR7_9FIRM|nr:FtsX-like permease family protein [Paeniclostridium ghonii]MDQ0556409.1 putative ABC transport system permease protein [Paeniclostridium ghonii]